jgi:hypothetical protein
MCDRVAGPATWVACHRGLYGKGRGEASLTKQGNKTEPVVRSKVSVRYVDE